MLIGICSCNKAPKQVETTQEDIPSDEKINNGIMSIQPSVDSDTMTWRGRLFSYEIDRHPNDTLPKVIEIENGTKFTDNQIDLTIKEGEKTFFKHTFFKTSFSKFLDEEFNKHSILEGMVYVGTQNGKLEFATSICYPHSDLYVPLLISIAPNGTFDICEDKIMDMNEETEEEP